jgi:hypothetical protein
MRVKLQVMSKPLKREAERFRGQEASKLARDFVGKAP